MFSSTIIPTVGRPSLNKAVMSVLEQELGEENFEVIVVNDSGIDLPYAEWQHSTQVTIINTAGHRERSVSRNTGAAVAKGKFLHFLDDDDWLIPGALQAFFDFAQKIDSAWLYGGSQLVDWDGKELICLEHDLHGNRFIQVLAGEWIPLQASLIKAPAFFKAGGFNSLISGPEDIDLLRRICLTGDVAGFPEIVTCIVRNDPKTTTDYDRHPELSRWAREKIFDEPAVFSRMLDSSNSPYWNGRVVRAYVTSLVWNLRNKRVFPAVSRMMYAAVGAILAGTDLLKKDFWKAVTRPYSSETFARGFERAKSDS